MNKGEYWWCGSVNRGHEMPYSETSDCIFDLDDSQDQFSPLMLSSQGRYIHSDRSFRGQVKDGEITLEGTGTFETGEGFEDLRGAYMAAMKKYFPFDGGLPDELFWKAPQYNTWIELGSDQRTEKILAYAHSIVDNGLKPGILMIDEGWQLEYGQFEFNRGKIPDPKYLMDELHKLGFKVILWVTQVVNCAGNYFCDLEEKGYFIKDKDGKLALRKWWKGYSAVLDLTNPEVIAFYHAGLHKMMEEYGVDGFKFDAGDRYFYEDDDITYKRIPARDHTTAFNEIGLKYRFNEYRSVWNYGGKPIVSRLYDKSPEWGNGNGLDTLLPQTILQGLSGYAYGCPDMVGGGYICEFDGKELDEELFIRWAQASAFMGMMQISLSPWRVLEKEHAKLVIDAINLHTEFGDKFYELARNASKTGEPIIRHMAYEFPNEGFEADNTQFMVGSEILVAPILKKGMTERTVHFPEGVWVAPDNTEYVGGKEIAFEVDLSTILYFFRRQ